MSEAKDMFNESVRKGLDDLEVPYNEAHWEEMNSLLDQHPVTPPKAGSSPWGYVITGGAAVVITAAYLLTSGPEEQKEVLPPVAEEQIKQEQVITEKPSTTEEALPLNRESAQEERPNQEAVSAEAQEIHIDHKADRYASLNEEQLKDAAKLEVEDAVAEHKSEIGESPQIDNPKLKANIVLKDGGICVGEEVKFSIEPKRSDVTYFWDFGDKGLKSRKEEPNHVFKRSGDFEVFVVISKKGEEKNDYTARMVVSVMDQPEVSLDLDNEAITLYDPYLEVSAESDQPCDFAWMFNNSDKGSGKEAKFLVPDGGNYPVQLTATSESGCQTEVVKQFYTVKGVKIHVENAFTPNGNNGNDIFIPKELQSGDVEFTLTVFDLSAKVVYQTNDPYGGWNGRLNNTGQDMPEGLYKWKLVFTDGQGVQHKQNGKINLLR